MSAKLDRIGADLEKARKKRAEWDAKVKDLERRYREEENSEIHEMVHAANLNPEQLSELLRMFAADMAPKPDTINTMNEEEAQHEIYEIMNDLAAQGKAIIMISSEMAELLGMSDRVYVMCDGKLRGEITEKEEMTQAKVMGYATQF